jgi:lipid-binding SYLF domain-containing protein
VVLLVMNQGGAKKMMSSKFTVGADATAALGPVGRDSSAATDAQMHAEILTYSRSRGVFAGVSLEGATLRPDEDWNKELYGKKISNQEVVLGGTPAPASAKRLISELNKYSSRRG